MCGSRILEEDDFQEFPNQSSRNYFLHASMNFKIFPDQFFFLNDDNYAIRSIPVVTSVEAKYTHNQLFKCYIKSQNGELKS